MAERTSFEKLINSDTPVLIDFYADWCGPCKAFAPILKEIKKEVEDNVRVVKIDVDKNKTISAKLQIRSIPTIHLYRNGNLHWEAKGVQSKSEILQRIESCIGNI